MELLVLSLFCAGLLACIIFDISILYALGAGLILFLLYGKRKGFSWKELAGVALSGIVKVRNILIAFMLIGMLTALWRDAGTISVIVCYAARLIRPSVFLVMTFLLNSMVSVLTGTAFGTAATMGVICATMAAAMGIDPAMVGGAVLGGAYFGDRCSPVSTSALLVAELTETSIFDNIKNMVRSAAIPFLLTCGVYGIVGLIFSGAGEVPDLQAVFERELVLSWVALLPAVVILTLSLMKVNVKKAMAASILTALPICVLVQGTPVGELPRLLFFGYQAADPQAAAMLNGGGIASMIRVAMIITISSSYSGIFQKTGLLDGVKRVVHNLALKTTGYTAALITSVVAGVIACNQTLAIMLTHQLCREVQPEKSRMALTLEDTAVVVAPLVPWSIAGAVPLTTIGAPTTALLWTCFLYLLPLWQLTVHTAKERKRK